MTVGLHRPPAVRRRRMRARWQPQHPLHAVRTARRAALLREQAALLRDHAALLLEHERLTANRGTPLEWRTHLDTLISHQRRLRTFRDALETWRLHGT